MRSKKPADHCFMASKYVSFLLSKPNSKKKERKKQKKYVRGEKNLEKEGSN